MKKILAVVAGLAVAISIASPAHALSGTWNKNEFNSLCTVQLDKQFGQLCPGDDSTSGATQTQAENVCDCTGDKIADWTQNGHDFKNLKYNSSAVNTNVIITYRKWDSGAPWRAYDKLWCDGTGCHDTA